MTSPDARRFRTAAFLALLAIVGMGYYLSSVMAAHLLRPDVDPVSEPVNNYAVGPYGFLIGIAIFVLGVGSLALTLGLHLSIAPPSRSRVGLLLLALYCVGQLGVAIFSIDAASTQSTTTGLVHNIAGNVSFFCFPPAVILLSLGMGKDERWRALKRPALALALVILELPSIGWQRFILDSSQSDPIAIPAFLDTYATRLLTEPLSRRRPRCKWHRST